MFLVYPGNSLDWASAWEGGGGDLGCWRGCAPTTFRVRIRQTKEGKLRIDFFPPICAVRRSRTARRGGPYFQANWPHLAMSLHLRCTLQHLHKEKTAEHHDRQQKWMHTRSLRHFTWKLTIIWTWEFKAACHWVQALPSLCRDQGPFSVEKHHCEFFKMLKASLINEHHII